MGIFQGVKEVERRGRKEETIKYFESVMITKKEAIGAAATKEDEIKATNSFNAAFSRLKKKI